MHLHLPGYPVTAEPKWLGGYFYKMSQIYKRKSVLVIAISGTILYNDR